MAEYTKNFNLEKQQGNDNISIEGLNENFDKIDTALGNSAKFEKASGTGTAIIINGIALEDGAGKTFIVSVNNNGAATTINGKKLYKSSTTTAPNLIAGKAVTVWYDLAGDCFFIKASAEGNAIAENVLAGKTFSNDNDTGIEGTMTNRSGTEHAATETYATQGFVLLRPPKGYYDGNQGSVVRWDDPNFKSANIRGGVSVFGVAGNSNVVDTSDGNIDAAKILTGYGGYSKGVKVNGNMPNNGAVSQSLPINGSYTIPTGYHNGSGKVNQSVATKGAQTYTPGTADQSIAAGQYLSGAQTIKGDANLISANILSGKSIFGVTGSVVAKRSASGTYAVIGGTDYKELYYYMASANSMSAYTADFWTMTISGLSFKPSIVIYYVVDELNYRYPAGMASSITENGTTNYNRPFAILSSGYTFSRNFSNNWPLHMSDGGFCVPLHRTSGLAYQRTYQWFAFE